MNFLEWIGLIVLIIVGLWLLIGVVRYLTLRAREDIRASWATALQCILLWPFSFWQA